MLKNITIAVDAMGGDGSPKKIVDGIKHHSKNSKGIKYLIFGDKDKILNHIPKNLNKSCFEIVHTKNCVDGKDTPLEAAKKGKDTSMWLSVDSVKKKESDIVISAGNTGALLVISKLNLKMIENIDKPALSALWPNKTGMSIVLDLGANIECNEKNLIDFSIMGASIFKSLYPEETAKVALLNIGSEEIMNGDVNIIVSDGFTGNVALKTAEGTANFITNELKKTYKKNILGKISGFINYFNLKSFKKRLDPRLYNGAIFIGLDSPVVKSHGATDYIGFSNSLSVCEKIVKGDLINKIKNNIYSEN